MIAGWLAGDGIPAGLTIDTELRWSILQALSAAGRVGEAEINAELDNDRTAGGERQAAIATALIATADGEGRDLAPADRPATRCRTGSSGRCSAASSTRRRSS